MLHELILKNGRIHTMDRDDTVVPDISIENGRIAALGSGLQPRGPMPWCWILPGARPSRD